MSGETTSLTIKALPTGVDAPPVKDETRPAWLPEKFKTAEEFAASYTELEKKLGTGDTKTTDLSSTEAATAALKAKDLDFTKLSDEYFANQGKLTDATMASLKEKGFSEDQVKQFVEGREAIARENSKGVFEAVGGQDRFNTLQNYAAAKFTPAEIEAYNKAVGVGDYATVKLMLQGLNTKFVAEFGSDGNRTSGGTSTTVADVYENFQAYRNAMKDPRYSNDRNYRKAVDAKLERSTFFRAKK